MYQDMSAWTLTHMFSMPALITLQGDEQVVFDDSRDLFTETLTKNANI